MRVIHQIEIVADCNLKCVYCPCNKGLTRKDNALFISDDHFDKALRLCKAFEKDTHELWLHGCGESLMHPNFLDYAVKTAETLEGVQIKLSTNGILLTEDVIKVLAENKILVHISIHKATRKTAEHTNLAHSYGILEHLGCIPIQSASNWAGQVDWPDYAPKGDCAWPKNQWACVLSDGTISTCCLDVNPKKPVGHVDEPLEILKNRIIWPVELCESCHLDPVM